MALLTVFVIMEAIALFVLIISNEQPEKIEKVKDMIDLVWRKLTDGR